MKNQPKNLRPPRCHGCGALIGGIGMTLMHGMWLCDICQEKEKQGILEPKTRV